MSNKIDTAMDALETALRTALVSTAPALLKAVVRGVINPLKQSAITTPVLALAVSRLSRESGRFWTADVLIQVVSLQKMSGADGAICELVAAIDGAINTHADGGSAGAVIDRPTWDMWYVQSDSALVPVGALAGLKMVVESPLKT